MSKNTVSDSLSVASLVDAATVEIDTLLHADVIDCTIGVMRRLLYSLSVLDQQVQDGNRDPELLHLADCLLELHSESIREALHRGEVGHITNPLIRAKNSLLRKLGKEVPDSHAEIDVTRFGTYHW